MKREIKFRAWDTDKLCFFDCKEHRIGKINNSYGGLSNRFVYQQFTGLYDKNGKEIYEGDIIISSFGSQNPCQILFGLYNDMTDLYSTLSQNVGFYFLEPTGDTTPFGTSIHGNTNCYEVIGNIYENPELLTKNQSK